MRRLFTKLVLSVTQVTIVVLVGYYLVRNQILSKSTHSILSHSNTEQNRNRIWEKTNINLSSNVRIVNLTGRSKKKFPCLKTKQILLNISTYICLYKKERDRYVSGLYHDSNDIFEEQQVINILQILIRHPRLHFIDLGANIGTYAMFVAALGRFVLAVDCFGPNLIRLRRAIQLANVSDRIVLVQNAIYNRSGESLKLSLDRINVGGQGIVPWRNNWWEDSSENYVPTKKSFTVKTITFNELLPILIAHDIRSAILKMDIEGSESFITDNSNQVFDTIDIPFIQMEWLKTRDYPDRIKVILDFFFKRHYIPMNELCFELDVNALEGWPNDIYWLKRNVPNFC